MPADTLFSICSSSVLPGWALLILLPRWKWTLGLISSGIIPFVLGLVYGTLLLSQITSLPEGGGFGSLEALMILFTSPEAVLVGWIHYLAFDLFIGAWELKDGQNKNIPHWMLIPCFVLTFLAGPVGLVLYLIIRSVRTKEILIYD